MSIRIQTQGFDLTPAIGAHVHEKMGHALDPFSDEVFAIDIYLKDLNGPKGGKDKQAFVRLQLRHRAPVMILTTHEDLYRAIEISARRCRRAVRRSVKKGQRLARARSRVSGIPELQGAGAR